LAYDVFREEHGPKRGAREYLEILFVAARGGEARVENAVRFLLGSHQVLNAEGTARLTEENAPALLNTVEVDAVSLDGFDELLTTGETAA
jgi:hypothetical protein